ncbi:hypothetical protein DRO58_01130 [Candidatus Bathyarchaeota archaeon]|nr:MAG: hypothetical protein DRO58_01130 [Candidatus Bathyarchaeota archaeon]
MWRFILDFKLQGFRAGRPRDEPLYKLRGKQGKLEEKGSKTKDLLFLRSTSLDCWITGNLEDCKFPEDLCK